MDMTLITSCSPFFGEKKWLQNLAFGSWQAQGLKVCVLGDDVGAEYESKRWEFCHIPKVKTAHQELKVDHYSIMLKDGLQKALPFTKDSDVVIWVNSDIILMPGVKDALDSVFKTHKEFVGWARRWDINWDGVFKVHDYCGIDLFVWTTDLFKKTVQDLPNFVVDAWSTDHYFARYMKTLSPNYFELTYIIKGLHFQHNTGTQLKGDWNVCAAYNRTLLNQTFSNPDPKPIILGVQK